MSSLKKQISGPCMGAQVHYTLAVIDSGSGREVRRLKRKRNLILDQGLDGIASRTWNNSFTHAVIGTGTTPTKRDSGAVTFIQSGTTVTASAGFFEAADVGRLLKFDSGEEMYVTAFTSATVVTVGTSGTLSAAEGTVWYVNQTALTTETKRTAILSGDGGANGTTYSGLTHTHKRTFIFSSESGTVNYREIGWSWTASAGANLFGRDLLAGVGVTLVAGQALRVVVQLSVTYGPDRVPYTSIITGWSQNGTCGVETIGPNGTALDPSSSVFAVITDTATAIYAPIVGDVNFGALGAAPLTLNPYTAGSFTRSKTAEFGVSVGNSTNIRSLLMGKQIGGSGVYISGFRILFDAAETKASTHKLTVTFTLTWGRVLIN